MLCMKRFDKRKPEIKKAIKKAVPINAFTFSFVARNTSKSSYRHHRAALRDSLASADTSSSLCIAFVAIFFKLAIECVHCGN